MRWSMPLGSIGDMVIRIHVTFLLLLVWIVAIYYREGGIQVASQGTVLIVIIFLCVLLHELGHFVAARYYGVRTRDVTLWPFGGIASTERIPEKPSQELIVALADPAVNIVIAGALLLWLGPRFDPGDSYVDVYEIKTPATPLMNLDRSRNNYYWSADEVMRQIRATKQFAQLPLIAVTAKAMKEDRDRCFEAGATDYLAKPIDVDELLSVLRICLHASG